MLHKKGKPTQKLKSATLISIICCKFLILYSTENTIAQGTFLDHGSYSQQLTERFEIRSGKLRNNVFTDIKPFNRMDVSEYLDVLATLELTYSTVDYYNLSYLRSDNLPWSSDTLEDSEKEIMNTFYKSKANLYQVNTESLDLFINPGIYFEAVYEHQNDELYYINSRAAEIRGTIDNKVGFYSFVSENQARPPEHILAFYRENQSYPGAHFTKRYGDDGVDFFTARGYITFSPTPSIHLQFGQDRNFIGNGYRSLLLSDFATDYLFLKVNTKVWRFNYQNIFAKMTDRYGFTQGYDRSRPYPAKYAAIHYLSLDILDNLNIGLFESVIFHDNRDDGRGFDVNYLNPVIFYRSVEHQLGDPDKMLIGMNLNYLPVKNVQLYGQFMINEFRIDELRAGDGYIHNKYGYQIGSRYIDVAGISNLDVGVEFNSVRPYSYTHYSISKDYAVNSYTHYNQALAHPLGANFNEWVFSITAQPFPKLKTALRYIHANYGADDNESNWGQNIFLDYNTFEREYGNKTGQGISTELNIAELLVSYQVRHNIFIDLNLRYRKLESEISERNSENLFTGATLRYNLFDHLSQQLNSF